MHIGIDASRANTLVRTGTEWYSWYLLKEFATQKLLDDVTLYLRSPLLDDLKPLPNTWHVKHLQWPPKLLWTQARLTVEMLAHKPDVLFVPAHTLPLVTPSRTVTTCHDVGFERFPELYSTKELRYHRFAMRRAMKSGATIITVSEFTKHELLHFYNIDPARVHVIYNGFDFARFAQRPTEEAIESVQSDFGITQPYILSIGRLETKKNTDGLLRAFAEFKKEYQTEHQLVLAGGWGTDSSNIQALYENHPYKKDIVITGYVHQEAYVALLHGSSLVAFLSRYEGFGFPVLEAFAAGKPLVGSTAGSIPEIGGDCAIYVDQQDTKAAAHAFAQQLQASNKQQLKQAQQRAQEFTWSKTAQQTAALILSQ